MAGTPVFPAGAHPGVAAGAAGRVAGVRGVRGGDDRGALARNLASSRCACRASPVSWQAYPPSISRSSAAASWQLYPWVNPPPRTGISRESGSVTFRTGWASSFRLAPAPRPRPARCLRLCRGRGLGPLQPGPLPGHPAGPSAGPAAAGPLPGGPRGPSSPTSGLLPRRPPAPGAIRAAATATAAGGRRRLPGGQRLQAGLPLRPRRRLGRLPLRGEVRQARPHPPGRDRGSAHPGPQRLPADRSAPGRPAAPAPRPPPASAMTCAASLRSPASVRFASFDAFAAILTPSAGHHRQPPQPRRRAHAQHLVKQVLHRPALPAGPLPEPGDRRMVGHQPRARQPERRIIPGTASSIARVDSTPRSTHTPAGSAASPGHTPAGPGPSSARPPASRAASSGVTSCSTVSITSQTT